MKSAIFGVVTGVVIAIAGTSVSTEPGKALALIAAMCIAHALTSRKS